MKTMASSLEAEYDRVLVSRFKSGDESAFTEIYGRYHRRIFNLMRHRSVDYYGAEEIAQETMVNVYGGLHKFRNESSLATWISKIAIRLISSRHRYFSARRRQVTVSLDSSVFVDGIKFKDILPSEYGSPRFEISNREFEEIIAECMKRMSSKQREVLVMSLISELPYDEIGQTLGISIGTVKSRVARARRSLKELVSETCPEFDIKSKTKMTAFFGPERKEV